MKEDSTSAAIISGQGKSWFIDLSRGVASQLVVLGYSLNITIPAYFVNADKIGNLTAKPGPLYMQNFGVLVFFFISGLLITSSVLRKTERGAFNAADYFADRFARIFTPLVPVLF